MDAFDWICVALLFLGLSSWVPLFLFARKI